MADPISQQAWTLVSCSKVFAALLQPPKRDGHNNWGKGTVFYFTHTLFVSPDLDPLMSHVAVRHCCRVDGAWGLKILTSK